MRKLIRHIVFVCGVLALVEDGVVLIRKKPEETLAEFEERASITPSLRIP